MRSHTIMKILVDEFKAHTEKPGELKVFPS